MVPSCRKVRLILVLCLAFLAESLMPIIAPAGAVPCDQPLPVNNERASEILATMRPFEPANPGLFYSAEHPAWRDSPPVDFVDGPALSEDETEAALKAFLERRFPCDPDRVYDGLAIFTDPIARMKAPEPAMRAALASLTGTLGEPAIRHVLYRSPVTLIHFGAVLERGSPFPSRLGIAYDLPDATRQIVLDRRFRFAPFASFAPILFHEALHTGIDDDVAGLPEESVATAMEALVYMEMLLTDPSLAAIPDDLTRGSNNVMAVARFNSGPAGTDDLTLFIPDSTVSISPTAVEPLTEFYEYYATYSSPDDDSTFRDRETQGNQLLEDVLALLAEPGVIPPDDPDFDQDTLAFVDQNQGVLTPAELIAVACILQLDIPCS